MFTNLLHTHKQSMLTDIKTQTPALFFSGLTEFASVSCAESMRRLYPILKAINQIIETSQQNFVYQNIIIKKNSEKVYSDTQITLVFQNEANAKKYILLVYQDKEISEDSIYFKLYKKNANNLERIVFSRWTEKPSQKKQLPTIVYPTTVSDIRYAELIEFFNLIRPTLTIMPVQLAAVQSGPYQETIKLLDSDGDLAGNNCLNHYNGMKNDIDEKIGYELFKKSLYAYNAMSFLLNEDREEQTIDVPPSYNVNKINASSAEAMFSIHNNREKEGDRNYLVRLELNDQHVTTEYQIYKNEGGQKENDGQEKISLKEKDLLFSYDPEDNVVIFHNDQTTPSEFNSVIKAIYTIAHAFEKRNYSIEKGRL